MITAKGKKGRGMGEKKKKIPNTCKRELDSNHNIYLSRDNNESRDEVESTTITTQTNKPVKNIHQILNMSLC